MRGFLFLICICGSLGFFIYYRYFINPWFFFSEADGHPLFRWVYYVVAYFMAVFFIALFFKKHAALVKTEFWILSVAILSVLYLNHFKDIFSTDSFPPASYYFLEKLFYNLQCVLLYSLAPLTAWLIYYKRKEPNWKLFGWSRKNNKLLPYFFLLALMLPLLYWASTRSDFQMTYPRYRPGNFEQEFGISPWLSVGGYELSYAFQFIGLEWFFRGFIVFSLSRMFGKQAVWIMVSLYVFLHFNKPLHETIGSFFGGYILGVLALETKSIYGGIIVHVGIALAMEALAAF